MAGPAAAWSPGIFAIYETVKICKKVNAAMHTVYETRGHYEAD